MKKTISLFILISLILSSSVFSQERVLPAKNLRNISAIKAGPVSETMNFSPEVKTQDNSKIPEGDVIGSTYYDLQSNASMQNRHYLYPDGFIGGTFTYGLEQSAFPDRGTGYNYFEGEGWDMAPMERIESDRSGWPSYAPWGESGEIVVAHFSGASDDGLVFSKRTEKGSGAWTEFYFYGPEGHALLWPRMVTSGDNHDVIHLLALTTPTGNGGSVYEGQDGALVYSRSSDGGDTWDIENLIIDGLGSDYYNGFEGDTYEFANPKGDTLAILIGNDWTDLILLKSTDNGDAWEKTIIWEHPYPLWNYTVTDTFYCPDGAHAAAIDNAGNVHIAFSLLKAYSDGISQMWFPLTDGIAYWNEEMDPFSNELNALSPYGDTGTELIVDYNLIGWMQDVNGNGELDILDEFSLYYLGASSMPQLVIDDENRLLLVYVSITETYDNGIKNYRHLWARTSANLGVDWGEFYDLNSDLIYIFSECVFPSCSPTSDDNFHLIYHMDNVPGLAVRGDLHEYVENSVQYMVIPKEDIITLPPGNAIAGTVVNQQGGNPLEGALITLSGTEFSKLTSDDGSYTIHFIPAGTYTVTCELAGYLTDSAMVVVDDLNTSVQNFSLLEIKPPEEEAIGETRYDLQSNASMQNRFHYFDDGTFGAVWTMGSNDPGFPERGTGYAYYNSAAWDPVFPEERIESLRTGWPSYAPFGAAGELVVSHDFSMGELILLSREEKGNGAWNEVAFDGPGDTEISWNRTITSGVENDVIHVLALTWPSSEMGVEYEGLDGAILYSRSQDGGMTWDVEHSMLDGMTSSEFTGFSADIFEWAAPMGDQIAFLVGHPWTDLFLMKSVDGGDTWDKMLVWENPYPFFDPANPIETDTFYCPDGAHHLAFDTAGKLHVVFGITRAYSDGVDEFFISEVDGIGYWNEDMEAFSNNLNALSPYGDPGSELVVDETLIAWSQDVNENGQLDFLDDWGEYHLGVSSMPQLVIDESNHRFLLYSSVTEGFDNSNQNFRHIWVRGYHAESQVWGEFLDLTDQYGECVFPSCAPVSDEEIHLVFMEDNEPGMAVLGDNDPYNDNYITYLSVSKDLLIAQYDVGSLAGQVTAFIGGDPLENATVALQGTAYQANTNEDGEYLIEGIPVGSYTALCSYPAYLTTNADVEITGNSVATKNFQLTQPGPINEMDIGLTYFDLQTNRSMQNRIHKYDDGSIGGVYTFGMLYYNGFGDRGTGYNYFDGSSWGDLATERIEDDRTGWPSYAPWGTGGEIVVSHYSGASTDGLVVHSRDTKGTGAWTSIDVEGPQPECPYLWARSATGGVDNSDLHLIALTTPVDNGGELYEGLDGALLYSRSPDGGQTWDHEHELLEGINSDFYHGFSGDSYEIQTQGDYVAFIVGDPWTGLVLMKSTDNGDTWEKTVIWEHPFPFLDPDVDSEIFYNADGAHAIAFDASGKVHVAFGINRCKIEAGGLYWYPEVDGIGYWNEDMPAFSDDLNALSPYGDPGSEMIEDYNLIAWSQDINGNGQLDFLDEWGTYVCGVSSMPQLVIDEWNRIVLVYSSVTENYDNGAKNYRHLWTRSSPDGGQSWGDFMPLTSGLSYIFSECVFPSCSQTSDDKIYLVFQEDAEPGMAVKGDEHPYTENNIVFMSFFKPDAIGTGGVLSGTVSDSGTGLPIENATIQIEGTAYTTSSTSAGTYSFPNVDPGIYTVWCSAMGYFNEFNTTEITTGNVSTLTFLLNAAETLEPPQNLEVSIDLPDVALEWDPPAAGSPSSYKLYRNQELIENTPSMTYFDFGLEPGLYEYFVTALYNNGESGPSNSVTVLAPEPCDAPDNVSASVLNQNQVMLEWNTSGSPDLVGYNIFINDDLMEFTTNTDAYYYDLQPGTYIFCVSTVCEEGESETVCADPITIVEGFASPWGLEVWANGQENMDLAWNAPVGGKSNDYTLPFNLNTPSKLALLGYNIYLQEGEGEWDFLDFIADTSYTHMIEGASTLYCYYITAMYEDGESNGSNTACEVLEGLPVNQPCKIQIYPNPASHTLHIYSTYRGLKIEVYTSAGNLLDVLEADGNYYQVDVSGILPGIYIFKIEIGNDTLVRRVVIN